MLASVGFLIQAAGIHFPGMISEELSFASLAAMKPVEQWINTPEIGELSSSALVPCESRSLQPDFLQSITNE